MPYCGRYGCGCCTCEDCGTYHGCVCDLKKRSADLVKKWDTGPIEDAEGFIEAAVEVLREWTE